MDNLDYREVINLQKLNQSIMDELKATREELQMNRKELSELRNQVSRANAPTKAEIMAVLDVEERQRLMIENRHLFNF